jgi:hypothetical protein
MQQSGFGGGGGRSTHLTPPKMSHMRKASVSIRELQQNLKRVVAVAAHCLQPLAQRTHAFRASIT